MPKEALQTAHDDIMALDELHSNWIHIPSRQIWIHSSPVEMTDPNISGIEPGVEYMMATKVIKNLHCLRMISSEDPVIIHMQTCGGIFEDGMAIYDTIKSMPFRVIIVNYTHARSMSSIILQAADYRFMMPHAQFMFHDGSFGMEAEVRTVVSNLDFYKKFGNKAMFDAYYERVKDGPKFQNTKYWTENRLRNFLRAEIDKKGDVFLTAEEAIEWGFADSILSDWQQIEDAKKA